MAYFENLISIDVLNMMFLTYQQIKECQNLNRTCLLIFWGMMQKYTSKSMIDLSLNVDRNMFRDVRAVPSLSMDSMHRMVIATLKWSKEKQTRKQSKTRLNVEKLKDANCAQDMRIKILSRLGESQADDLEGEWSTRYFFIRNRFIRNLHVEGRNI